MNAVPTLHVPSTLVVPQRRGGTRTRQWTAVESRRRQELLDLAWQTWSSASDLPIDDATRRIFFRTYRSAAERLVDRRVWELVGHQLLAWLTHGAQSASEHARARGATVITPIDFRHAVRETHRISASPYCPPDPDEPGGP